MSVYQKCIPDYYFGTIFDIPYQTLKEQGYSTLFFDLDNTIIGYDEDVLSKKQVQFLSELAKSFKIVIISNSGYKRVSNALKETVFEYVYYAKKPLKFGFNKALKKAQSNKSETVLIGDQLMTDVFGAHRFGITAILVKSVKRKSDRKITQMNRKIERFVLKKIKKRYPSLYEERLDTYVNDHKM